MYSRLKPLVFGIGITLSGGVGQAAQVVDGQQAAATFDGFGQAQQQFEFLNEYCVECHNFEEWAGGIAFDTMRPETVAEDAAVWETAVRKLRGHLMPPAGSARPDGARADEFVGWMESYLDHAATTSPAQGHVGLHRLNRKEYANAVRDLLGIEVEAESMLPQDPTVDGFDNVAAALTVTPSFIDQALTAARTVAAQSIGNPNARPGSRQYFVSGVGTQHHHVPGTPLGTRGGMAVVHEFPADGEYELNIGNLATALWVFNQEFTHTLIAAYDDRQIFELDIGGGEDLRAIDQEGDPAVDAINARLKNIRFHAQAGPHTIAVAFKLRSFAANESALQPIVPGEGENVIALGSFDVTGPFEPTGVSATPSRDRIFACYPETAAAEPDCAREIISRLAELAYRGVVPDSNFQRLLEIYQTGRDDAGFDVGIRRAVAAVLASPRFLYRSEVLPDDAAPGATFAVSDLELASRLSFFLWSSIPDAELLALAKANRLHESKVLEQQVRRMLADQRAENLTTNFAFQWLEVNGIDELAPDPRIFADVDSGIRPLFKEEIRLFVDSVFRADRNVLDLLTADYTFVNERLAAHYGMNDVKGDQFRRVTLPDSARSGLLGKGSVLMVSAYPDRTAPVLRGAFVLENILGTPPAAPPPNVEGLKENVDGAKPLTVRERMEAHRANPNCNGCHGLMDPLGFALENFDSVGRWREIDRFVGSPIDATGELPDGTLMHGPDDLRKALLRKPDQFVQNLTEKLMLFALGRPVEYFDMPAVRQIVREAARQDYRFSSIIMGIVSSEQFQTKSKPVPADSSLEHVADRN
ncbi:MAG: DUF1592 domain-containing protein [Gammaproteobacteria bacterium]|nr:DUF1592 domain-containing protein [Gammaproteobacteria bacterium]